MTLLAPLLSLGSDVAVAVSTLLVTMLLAPLRHRVQRVVDARFNRTKYMADRGLDRFTSRHHAASGDEMVDDLAGIVQRTLQPASTLVWIRTAVGEI